MGVAAGVGLAEGGQGPGGVFVEDRGGPRGAAGGLEFLRDTAEFELGVAVGIEIR